ncbi:hypothetical protein GH733_004995 [Mirounga leonina]|nr:hypothetical protein GH733_004995 [Mirounga leonina]
MKNTPRTVKNSVRTLKSLQRNTGRSDLCTKLCGDPFQRVCADTPQSRTLWKTDTCRHLAFALQEETAVSHISVLLRQSPEDNNSDAEVNMIFFFLFLSIDYLCSHSLTGAVGLLRGHAAVFTVQGGTRVAALFATPPPGQRAVSPVLHIHYSGFDRKSTLSEKLHSFSCSTRITSSEIASVPLPFNLFGKTLGKHNQPSGTMALSRAGHEETGNTDARVTQEAETHWLCTTGLNPFGDKAFGLHSGGDRDVPIIISNIGKYREHNIRSEDRHSGLTLLSALTLHPYPLGECTKAQLWTKSSNEDEKLTSFTLFRSCFNKAGENLDAWSSRQSKIYTTVHLIKTYQIAGMCRPRFRISCHLPHGALPLSPRRGAREHPFFAVRNKSPTTIQCLEDSRVNHSLKTSLVGFWRKAYPSSLHKTLQPPPRILNLHRQKPEKAAMMQTPELAPESEEGRRKKSYNNQERVYSHTELLLPLPLPLPPPPRLLLVLLLRKRLGGGRPSTT